MPVCTVCSDYNTQNLQAFDARCIDSSCETCIATFVKLQIEQQNSRIGCMCGDCETLTHKMIKTLVELFLHSEKDSLIQQYEETVCGKLIMSRIFFCQGCEKKTRVIYSDVESYGEFPLYEEPATCKECGIEFCDNCATSDCNGECSFLLWEDCAYADSYDEKRCPRCRAILTLECGCASVQCLACHFCFCWDCLEGVPPIMDPSSHECSNFQGYDELQYSSEESE